MLICRSVECLKYSECFGGERLRLCQGGLTTASAAASPAEVPLSERPEVRKHRDMSREALLIDLKAQQLMCYHLIKLLQLK